MLSDRIELQRQLAESHAREVQLREALQEWIGGWTAEELQQWKDQGWKAHNHVAPNGPPTVAMVERALAALASPSGAAEAVRQAMEALWEVKADMIRRARIGIEGFSDDDLWANLCQLIPPKAVDTALTALREHFPGLLPAEDTT